MSSTTDLLRQPIAFPPPFPATHSGRPIGSQLELERQLKGA